MINTTAFHNLWCKLRKYLLAFSWCLGLLMGIATAHTASDKLVPLMYIATRSDVSVTGLFVSCVFPILLSACEVYFSEPWLLLPISTLKAFGFGFCSFGVSLAFGSASWLVRLLFLFSDICVIPLLFLYWIRHIGDVSGKTGRELAGCIAVATAVAATDFYVISPFLVKLIEF